MRVVLLAVCLALTVCGAAAFTGSAIGPIMVGTTQYDFQVTAFDDPIPFNGQVGPVDIAFDSTGATYITYYATNQITKFAPGANGMPSNANRLWTVSTLPYQSPCGMAFGKDGTMYVGFQTVGYIVSMDKATGALGADLLASVPGAVRGGLTALANDPISKDLYYEVLSNAVFRIKGTGVGETLSLELYTNNNFGCGIDGLYFDKVGTLYSAACNFVWSVPYHASGYQVSTLFTTMSTVDGTASSLNGDIVLGNRNDGIVSLAEVVNGVAQPPINVFSGGSRGDLAAVGPDGCFYFTQTDSVLKLTTLPDGKCNLSPTQTDDNACGANCHNSKTVSACASVLTAAGSSSNGNCLTLQFDHSC